MNIIDLARAIERQSAVLLNNMGISVDMSKLPTAAGYQNACAAFYGVGWLGRFWAKHVRQRIAPEKHVRLYHELHAWEALHRQAFMAAVMEQADKMGFFEEAH